MTDDDKPIIRFTFPDTDRLPGVPHAHKPPPPRYDPDPGISAEIAVETGVANEEEEAWVEWLREPGRSVLTGDSIEVDMTPEQAAPGVLTTYFVDDLGAPKLSNPDGTVTRVDSTVPDPTHERKDR